MQSRLSYALTMVLTLAAARTALGTCSIQHELSDLDAVPARCSQTQLHRLQNALSNRLGFRASLDLPLARQVLRERKCPSVDEFETFFSARSAWPGTGRTYTVQRYCSTPPTYYLIRFPYPDKPLDDAAAARLGVDIDRLQNTLIPSLVSKTSAVTGMLR